jgi:transcriptional regulator of aromatic amino acid metabolism
MHPTDFSSPADTSLLLSLLTTGPRPTMMVLCDHRKPEAVAESLTTLCGPPVHRCRIPGQLRLPPAKHGTLILSDASALSLVQQIELHDWLNASRGAVQVISVTSQPIWPLVEEGRFLEGLFYRLNVVTLEASQAL